MLTKIIEIRNIGRFKNSVSKPNPTLSSYTFVLGANGIGKTTLCAIFRSLKNEDSDYILGRKRLGSNDVPKVDLLLDGENIRYNDMHWSDRYPHIAIFDNQFIAENVHSGEVVETDHRRNLYLVIIGEQGVQLARKEAELVQAIREKSSHLSELEKLISPHIPSTMSLEGFIDLPQDSDVDKKCKLQEQKVKAAAEANKLRAQELLSNYPLPVLSDDLMPLLARTLDDVEKDAERLLAEHLEKHCMEKDGSAWIAKGMEYEFKETCPFCGQNTQEARLISVYQSVFSDQYRNLKADIGVMSDQTKDQFGEGAFNSRHSIRERNANAIEFWQNYCTLDPATVTPDDALIGGFKDFGRLVGDLLKRKDGAPLEPIATNTDFSAARSSYKSSYSNLVKINDEIIKVNELIKTLKEEIEVADIDEYEAELKRLRAIQSRHLDPVAQHCADYGLARREKNRIEGEKNQLRQQLNDHSANVIEPYENRINWYLDGFNAGFRISKTKHNYKGGRANSSYQLVINDIAIDLGDGRTALNQPSFKNTLSSGDRSTLALAFFLTNLENNSSIAKKTAVFDDPFSSQDSFRRRRTIHAISRIGEKCAQVIVLSHDAPFLKALWDKAPTSDRTALNLRDHRLGGTKITEVDLENACRGRMAGDIDDLLTYLDRGVGEPRDVIRKMRGVLETYCWNNYSSSFEAEQDWLGDIAKKIREGGNLHPAQHLYDDLEEINGYTVPYHHGETQITGSTSDSPIDFQELTGYVKRTLKLINALQA